MWGASLPAKYKSADVITYNFISLIG
jgi:hypothetical protein